MDKLETQNWKELSAVQIGGAICMPMILIGFELARQSVETAIYAIVIGNLFLFLLALLTSKMSYEGKMTTAENAASYFGALGKAFFACILLFSMCTWFAIQSQVMAEDLGRVLPEIDRGLLSMLVSSVIVVATLKGIRAVTWLANLALPLMVITLLICLAMAFQQQREEAIERGGDLFQGTSLVIAAAILAVVDLPTFFRHACTRKDAIKASVAIFLVGMPLVELFGVFLGAWTNATDLSGAFLCFGHVIWKGWIWLFILLVGWTTNNANLYSGAMCLQTLVPQMGAKRAIFAAGLLAVALSAVNILARFEFVLGLMGVCVASMGAVVLASYFLQRRHVKIQSLSWLLGLSWGLLHLNGIVRITPIAIIDASLVSAVTIFLAWRCRHEKILTN